MKLPFKKPVVIPVEQELPEFSSKRRVNRCDSSSGFSRASDISFSSETESEDRREVAFKLGLDYIKRGLVPTPLVGKRPIIKGWQNTTLDDAEEKLSSVNNYNNVGILTGEPSGITVIDIDGDEGLKNFRKILKSVGLKYKGDPEDLLDTYIVKTGRNGYHFYFKYDGGKLNSSPLRLKKSQHLNIDIKNDGGQVVAAGSIHPDTNREYVVVNDAKINKMSKELLKKLISLQKS